MLNYGHFHESINVSGHEVKIYYDTINKMWFAYIPHLNIDTKRVFYKEDLFHLIDILIKKNITKIEWEWSIQEK